MMPRFKSSHSYSEPQPASAEEHLSSSAPPSLDKTLSLPKSVGSRELKTRLGSYLRLVRQGATFVVTDRGRPVAELRPLPVDEHALSDKLYELAAAGIIGQEIAERRSLQPFKAIATQDGFKSASEAILEDREDRF